ncbi:MAG: hypothetical protein PHV18_12180 [Lachnospiraceae bacterium]|nr:hypothetical protein [Lachnospiraceae bacterium]
MEEFKVVTKKLRTAGDQVSQMAREMESMNESVRRIRSNLRNKIVREEQIGQRLNQISDAMDEVEKRMTQYAGKAGVISVLYNQTEQKVREFGTVKDSGVITGAGAAVVGAGGAMSTGGGEGGGAGGGGGRGGAESETGTEEPKKSVAWVEGHVQKDGKIGDIDTHGEASGEIGGASYDTKLTSGIKWKQEKDENGNITRKLEDLSLIGASIVGEAHLLKGSAKGNIGLLGGEVNATVGKVSAKGEVNASLYQNGKLSPQLKAGVGASAVGAEGDANVTLGTDNTNVHTDAEGKLGVAKAEAEAQLGKITYKTEDGSEVVEGYGVSAKAGAEAYLAEGKVSGGVTILGIKIDAGISGKAGGVGATASGCATTGGVKASVGLGLGLGLGLDISVDWTGFKWGW